MNLVSISCTALTSNESGEDDDFNQGTASRIITGANLHQVVMDCDTELTNPGSTLSCELGFLNNSTFVSATGFEEDSFGTQLVFADWDHVRLYGDYLNPTNIDCEEQNNGRTYVCTYNEDNKAVRIRISAEITKPSESLSNTISNDESFFNLCDTIGSATTYNAYGSGTVDDPYILCFADQLKDLANKSTNPAHLAALSAVYRLGKNIDNIGNIVTIASSDPGFYEAAFTGIFQGNGYTLSDMIMIKNDSFDPVARGSVVGLGMFHGLRHASIDYLTIDNATLNNNFVGGPTLYETGFLAGRITGNTVINHVTIKNSTMTSNYAGFIARWLISYGDNNNTTTITNNSFESNTWIYNTAGGALSGFGGLFWSTQPDTSGVNHVANINNNRVIDTTIDGSNGNPEVGMMTGYAVEGNFDNNYVSGCTITDYGAGSVFGGLFSRMGGLLVANNNYSSCAMPAGQSGGLSYYDLGAPPNIPVGISGYYWDEDVSGVSVAYFGAGGTYPGQAEAKTTAQMQNQATYIGWDFVTIWDIITGAYPHLRALD